MSRNKPRKVRGWWELWTMCPLCEEYINVNGREEVECPFCNEVLTVVIGRQEDKRDAAE